MRMTRRQALGALALAAVSLSAGIPASAAQRAKHVFIVSFDGGKPAVMQGSAMPTLMRIRKEGAGTWSAQTVLPSITLVSHTSMLTGVQPVKHKIDWNDWIPSKGLVTVPTVFSLAKAKGFTTALYAGKEKFKHLNVPNTVDHFAIPDYSAKKVAAAAAECIARYKPNLFFIHFADSDGAGHQYGWGSPEQKKAFADEDDALKVVCEAIKAAGIAMDSVVILSADHGGHAKTHGTSMPEDMTIPWIVWGKGVRKDFAITAPVSTCDTAATALWLLGVPIPKEFDGKPVKTAFGK